jgi:uncharacterized protein (TIGR00369 family)
MSEQHPGSVPAGFRPLPRGLGFSDVIQPSYIRTAGETVAVGLVAGPDHANSMGVVHGGVLMTLADLAAASGVNVARGEGAGAPTVNLTLDFISQCRLGRWVQADVLQVSLKRRFGFTSGTIHTTDGVVARFNGIFYLPDHDGLWRGDGPLLDPFGVG